MYQSNRRIKAVSSLEILASMGLAFGLSSWAMGQQECGVGDVVSIEPCLVDGDTDTINGGCNSDPDAFNENAVIGGSISGSVSTYNANTRDTDWYFVSAADLAAADADGNGIVVMTHSGSAEMPVVLFIVALGDPLCSGAAVIGETGWAGPACGDAGSPSRAVIEIADHPNGIVFYIAPGNPDGTSINTGFPCSGSPGGFDYVINMEIIELPTSCNFNNEPCNVAHNGPGCNDPECCATVCEIDAACCDSVWDQICVDQAVADGCALGIGAPVFLASGPDDSVDGYLDLFADGFGSEAASFGGGPAWLDNYNPVGAGLQSPGFTNTTFLFMGGTERQILSQHEGSLGAWDGNTMSTGFTAATDISDQNADGIDDQAVSHFSVSGPLSLDVNLTQTLNSVTAGPGVTHATWTLSYEITNTGAAATFDVVRWIDADIEWQGDFNNDVVGTGTNAGTNCDRYVYQGEDGSPNLSITLSSNVPDAQYVGSKLTYDPDCDGPVIPFGFGTDGGQYWAEFGIPDGWSNILPVAGNDTDGVSGTSPDDGCGNLGTDGSIGIFATVTLAANATTTVSFQHTYGAITPDGADCSPGGGCVWDLDASGAVGTSDLLDLFAQWGTAGAADFDGSGAVGTGDLLILFAHWGPCP